MSEAEHAGILARMLTTSDWHTQSDSKQRCAYEGRAPRGGGVSHPYSASGLDSTRSGPTRIANKGCQETLLPIRRRTPLNSRYRPIAVFRIPAVVNLNAEEADVGTTKASSRSRRQQGHPLLPELVTHLLEPSWPSTQSKRIIYYSRSVGSSTDEYSRIFQPSDAPIT